MTVRVIADDLPARLPVSRREWLRFGTLAGLGFASQFASRSVGAMPTKVTLNRPTGFGRAKSVVVLHASGGQSQLDTWDPKPDAPEGIRGEFSSIMTSVPGVRFCEHLPRISRLADKICVIRSMSHDDLDHGSATYLTLTGQFHPKKSSNELPRPEDAPALGAILQRLERPKNFPYSAIHLNGPILIPELPSPGQYGGYLGRAYEPLTIGNVTNGVDVLAGLDPQPELPFIRQSNRAALLEAFDRTRRECEINRASQSMNELYRQAHSLLESPRCRQAFDLTQEPVPVRDRYGRFPTGQACLLARRLVEAEIPLITVFLNQSVRGQDLTPAITDAYGWDTHNDIFVAMKNHLLPRFDLSVSAFLEDLHERGLLDSTLVICQGEFGRAPLVALEPNFKGSTPGRKHWAAVYSIMATGAGVSRGRTLGSSDRSAAYPETTPFSPADVAATMFSALGIDPSGHYFDTLRRPIPIASGKPIEDLY